MFCCSEGTSRPKPSAPQGKKSFVHSESIFDDYTFGETLGHGAFGEVKRCRSTQGGPERAVKILDLANPAVQAQSEVLAVKNEVDILKHLSHSNIVKFIDLYEDDRFLYIIMELVRGGELMDALCMPGAQVMESDVAELARMLMQALTYLHSEGIVHRDIKAQNLLLTKPPQSGRVLMRETIKLIDFGMAAKLPYGRDPGFDNMCGSAAYRAPEVFATATDAPAEWKQNFGTEYGTKADIWAAGVVFYLTLTGALPYRGADSRAVADQVCNIEQQVNLRPGGQELGDPCAKFLLKCFTKQPNRRYTAREALADTYIVTRGMAGGKASTTAVPKEKLQKAKAEAGSAMKLDPRYLMSKASEKMKSLREKAFNKQKTRALEDTDDEDYLSEEEYDEHTDSREQDDGICSVQ
mmetsp:Transcript_34853/g.81433  ORF Transcript_34853/g.81433 Transcript_34853/m.81433 type:complete len:409 (+) Transcript_34853:92-1318(+)